MRWEDEALMEWKSRWTNIYLLFLSSVHALAPQQKRLFERAKYWRKLATTSLIPTSCSLIVQGQKGTCLSEESLNPTGSHSALPPMTQLQHWCHNTTAYLCYSLKSSASSTLSSFIFFNLYILSQGWNKPVLEHWSIWIQIGPLHITVLFHKLSIQERNWGQWWGKRG